MALRAIKLFLILWVLALIPQSIMAMRGGEMDALIIAEAAGFAIPPFLFGLLALVLFRKKGDAGWRDALIVGIVILALASWGFLSR